MITSLQNLQDNLKNWWIHVFNGMLLIIAGAGMLAMPEAAYAGLGTLFAVLLLLGGLATTVFALKGRELLPNWGQFLAGGLLQLGASVYLFLHPGLQADALSVVFGFYLLYQAVNLITASMDLKRFGIRNHGWVLFAGLVILALSIAIFAHPATVGMGTIVTLTAIVLMAIGGDFIWLGNRLNRARKDVNGLKKEVGEGLKTIKEQVEREYPGAEAEFKQAWKELMETEEQLQEEEAKELQES